MPWNFHSYLRGVTLFKRGTTKSHTLVIGNQAADADSLIAAAAYAFLRHSQTGIGKISPLHTPIIPITAVKRCQLYLRRDVEVLLKEVDLNLCDLLTIDEYIGVETVIKDGNRPSSVVLVDHNEVTHDLFSKLGFSSMAQVDDPLLVKEILDLHKDGGRHLHSTKSNSGIREIAFDTATGKAIVGSTCTLVAEKYLTGDNHVALSQDIATLLVGVIALDTYNMDVHLCTQRDRAALLALITRYPSINRDRLFTIMSNAKFDPDFWQSLTARDAIRLDFKAFEGVASGMIRPTSTNQSTAFGIAVILQPISAFVMKSDLVDELTAMLRPENAANAYDMLVVMTFVVEPVPRRELLCICRTKEQMSTLSKYLEQNKSLRLIPLDHLSQQATKNLGSLFAVRAYHQDNLHMNRKQVAPILVDYYSTEFR